jgi:hypothetical protein
MPPRGYLDPDTPRGPLALPPTGAPAPAPGGDWFASNAPPPPVPSPTGGSAPINAQQSLQALQASPGYQLRLTEGQKALERSAASRGTLLTGGTAKALQRYGQEFASTEYDKRQQQLFSLAGLGYNAAATQAGANARYATTMGDLLTQQGNTNAAGTIGVGNAWSQGLGGVADAATLYYLGQMGAFGDRGGLANPNPFTGVRTMSGVPPTGYPWG